MTDTQDVLLPRLGAVLVLYHPTPAQVDHALALVARLADLVVVDNSVAADAPWRARLRAAGACWILHRNQGGIAGAFNRGVAALARRDLAAFVLLDQDSVPPPGFFRTMAGVCADQLARGQTRFLLGPRVRDARTGADLPVLVPAGRWVRPRRWPAGQGEVPPGASSALPPATVHTATWPCTHLISSGCVVSRAAWRAIGAWREDFVMDHVDTDYVLRARALGIPMALVPSLVLRHAIGDRLSRRVFGVAVSAMNHGPQRRYYLARNAVALARGASAGPMAALLLNALSAWQVVTILLVEPAKAAKLRALAWGLLDGARGRLGPVAQTRPALACGVETGPGPWTAPPPHTVDGARP